jgi:hypothetical protein
MKRTLLYHVFKWRFNRLNISFKKWSKRFHAAAPLSETRVKCLKKEQKIIRERQWLLVHMYTI